MYISVPINHSFPTSFFSFHQCNLPYILHNFHHLYADDLQIYAQAKLNYLDDAILALIEDLRHITDWSRKFGINQCQRPSAKVLSWLVLHALSKLDMNSVVRLSCDGTPNVFVYRVVNLKNYVD